MYNEDNIYLLNNEYTTIIEYIDAKHVRCICKLCNNEYTTTVSSLKNKSIHKPCYTKIHKIHNSLSINDVKKYNNEYSQIIEYINSRKVICRCLICGELYQTKLDSIKNKSCHKKCRPYINKDINKIKAKQITNKLKEKEYDFVEVIEYISATDVVYKCKICNEIYHATIETINKNYIHRPCFSKYHKLEKQKQEDVVLKIENKNPHLSVVGEYNGAKENIKVKCNDCGFEWESNANELYSKTKYCPQCCMSYGEYKISQYLINHKINFTTQKTFDDCKYKGKLRFDFYIEKYNLCIEYQGIQHYKPVDFTSKLTIEEVEDLFKENQKRDNIKRVFCDKNNIYLLEIKYTDFENIDIILDKYFKNA